MGSRGSSSVWGHMEVVVYGVTWKEWCMGSHGSSGVWGHMEVVVYGVTWK